MLTTDMFIAELEVVVIDGVHPDYCRVGTIQRIVKTLRGPRPVVLLYATETKAEVNVLLWPCQMSPVRPSSIRINRGSDSEKLPRAEKTISKTKKG